MEELKVQTAYAAFTLSCLSTLRNGSAFDLHWVSSKPPGPTLLLTGGVLAAVSAYTALSHYDPCTSGLLDECYPLFLHSQVAISLLVQYSGELTNALQMYPSDRLTNVSFAIYRLLPATVTCRLTIVFSVLLALFYSASLGNEQLNWKQRSAAMHVVVIESVLWQVSSAWSERLYEWPGQHGVQLAGWEAVLYVALAIVLLSLFARQFS